MYDGYKQLDRMNIEFIKLGMWIYSFSFALFFFQVLSSFAVHFSHLPGSRGVTILAATGDGGSHWSFQPFPSDPIGQELNVIGCQYNWPTFPSASPFVTAVGGAQYQVRD
jgi:subtilase family serine protease